MKKIRLNKSLKNSIYYVSAMIIQKAILFVMMLLYTDYLTPDEFGLANIVISISTVYALIFRFAIDEAFARFWFKYRNDAVEREKLSGSIILSSIISCLGGAILLFAFSSILIEPFFVVELSFGYIVLCVILSVTPIPYAVFQKKLRIEENARSYTFYALLSTILTVIGATVFVILLDWGAYGYLLAVAGAGVATFVISLISLSCGVAKLYDKKNVKELYCYAAPLAPHFVATLGLTDFNRIVIGKILGAYSVGIYNVMNSFGMIVSMLSVSVTYVFQPWIYNQLEFGDSGNRRIKKIVELTTVLFIVAGLFVSLFSIEIVKLLINEQYWNGISLIPIIVGASNIAFIGNMVTYIMYYNKETSKHIFYTTIIGALTNVTLTIVLGKLLGMTGAAIAYYVANFVITELKRIIIKKKIEMRSFSTLLYLFITATTVIGFGSVHFEIGLLHRCIVFIITAGVFAFMYRKDIINAKETFVQ